MYYRDKRGEMKNASTKLNKRHGYRLHIHLYARLEKELY